MSLAIVHREPGRAAISPGAATWRTCLREVTFIDEMHHESSGDGQRLCEGDAYRLLLEILCGLKSPMIGETQVMGQFKAFLSSLGREHAPLNKLGQRLLGDAKDVRAKYLQGLGSRSYGSAVRRYLVGCRQAVLIGTGKLANEVLPFLDDDGRMVDQWGRSDDAAQAGSANVHYYSMEREAACPVTSLPTVLIIAAPIPSACIDGLAKHYTNIQSVIDLRADVGDEMPHLAAPIITLQDVFDSMGAANAFAVPQINAAKAEVVTRSRRFEFRDELRPFGWEDLCA